KKYFELCQSVKHISQSDLELPQEQEGKHRLLASGAGNLFTYVVEKFRRVHLTFDALDECDGREKWLLPFLCGLVDRYRRHPELLVQMKIFVTSRRQRDIEQAFSAVPTIHIVAQNVDSDIRSFVGYQLQQRLDDGSLGSVHFRLKDEIANRLAAKANGMFLWVKFQLADICEQFYEYGIRQILDQLPESLHEYYDRVVLAIDSQSRPVRDVVNIAIRCIAAAPRRLQFSDLCGAIVVLEDGSPATENLIESFTESHLIQVCHNLVDSNCGTLGFAHFSVLEFFLSEHMRDHSNARLRKYYVDLAENNFRMALACLRCLQSRPRDRMQMFWPPTNSLGGGSAGGVSSYEGRSNLGGHYGDLAWSYASSHLSHHLSSVDPDRLCDPTVLPLFIDATKNIPEAGGPIRYAARLGLLPLLRALLISRTWDKEPCEHALRELSRRNSEDKLYTEVLTLLLENGAHLGAMSPLLGKGIPRQLPEL
ncbi:hypothetical protein OQA88_3159, partial [Cercophora sp. LCS_1]